MRGSRFAAGVGAMVLLVLAAGKAQAETLVVFAPGSLRQALTDIATDFQASHDTSIELKFGAAGLLRDRLGMGERAGLFISADMAVPKELESEGRGGPVAVIALNTLCAMARPGLTLTAPTLLERMLDPALKLGISTPGADPSGDYALAVFANAELVHPGAQAALTAKANPLIGGLHSDKVPDGRNAYAYMLASGRADVMLGYCTGAIPAKAEVPGITVVPVSFPLAVSAPYGMTILSARRGVASPAAAAFAFYLLSQEAQDRLARAGFITLIGRINVPPVAAPAETARP